MPRTTRARKAGATNQTAARQAETTATEPTGAETTATEPTGAETAAMEPTGAETTATEPTGAKSTGPEATAADEQKDPVAALAAAYTQAIAARHEETGAIAAVELDAVRGAYGQVPKRKRSNLVTRLAGEAAQNMTTADGQVDTGLAAAIGTLTALFARLDTQERPESQPHDPVPAVAGVLAVLDRAREEILASLSDEQRERVPQVDTESDPAAQTWVAATLAAVSKVADPAVNGRSRASGGNRTSARETAKRIQVAVAEAEAPLTLSELADKAGVSAATLWSRWKADNTPGVVPFEDGKGRKAFKAA